MTTDAELLAELMSTPGIPLTSIAKEADRAAPFVSAERVTVCRGCEFLEGANCQKLLGNVYAIARVKDQKCPEAKW